MKQYQQIDVKYMHNTDRIQINDTRFKNKLYIPAKTGNVLTDVEKFLNNYNYKIIGYASNFETEIYTLLIENQLDKNAFRPIDKNEYSIGGY